MSITKKPYEISLWEDTLVFVGASGENYIDITKAEEEIVAQYYKETRLCTIGSDTMDSPARAVNGKLVRKVNGEVTFTFTVYYRYYDNETGQLEYNPFIPYLTNERKVKLKYDGEWYDLIIKQVQENSETKAFTYTCKSQFVNELSKTGFELEFDNELENNMGTVEYLAEQILAGSDWVLEGNSDLKQFIEEPLYKVKIKSDANLTITVMNPIEERNTIPNIAGKYVYVFYSHINDQQEQWQFLYDEGPFSVNDDLVIDKDMYPNYLIESVSYTEGANWPEFVEYGSITSDYRGMRLVKQARTIYDAKIDKYVQEYTKKDDTTDTVYYGFEETKYLSPNAVNNYIVNPNAFTSTTGWYVQPNAQGAKATLELESDPPFNATNIGNDSINFTSYLKFPNNGGALVNSSINSYKSSLDGFIEGETTYVLRIKCKSNKSSQSYDIVPDSIYICQYENMTSFKATKQIFEFDPVTISSTNEEEKDSNFKYYKATCLTTVTEKDFKNWDNYYGLFLTFNKEQYGEIYIEDIQLFPYILDNDNRLCVPGGELFAKVETVKKYYNPSLPYSSFEEIQFEPTMPEGTYIPKYADGAEAYTKVSSITAKESNRFNLLQDLNEKFECWARFRVDHNPDTGEILYGKDVGLTGDEAYRQQKFISFHEYAGKPNYVGFKYGINSKSIQRTLDSNAIVSKMIVKDNANEFARNGFCSIARAIDNSSKENFVLNFDHYYRHGLLDLDVVTNDLYVDSNGYLGYYKKLKEINRDREALIDEQANLLKEIANYEAQYQTYKTSHDSAIEERNQMEDNIFLLIVPKDEREKDKTEGGAKGLEFAEIINKYSSGWEENSSYIKYKTSWMQCDNVIKQHLPLYQKAEEYLHDCENRYERITEDLKEKTNQKRALNLQFYKKYSRFIQEGSWIKEDYIDDNLYYLDSLSTLHTSAQPKVTYNISVIDVSPLPGYEDYEFELGDITYIEDREFFGYSLIDGTTPYREEIVVSEITTELDAPEKNSIKVQNYKTQFEDLFQRITAQTQQAEYHTGEYKRAASIVEPGGNISVSTLENSFANNSFKLSNVRDQSVVIDEFGITSTSLANPSEMVRIVNGGIFMSTDGGQSWKTGLTGYGLNSSYMTAGQINTDEIYIMSGSQPAFGWDEKGISAYKLNGSHYDLNSCVRFDRHGIYGITDSAEYASVEEVMESALFAMTWKGFSLKNDDGSVSITSNDDIKVEEVIKSYEDTDQEIIESETRIARIKIGRIGSFQNEDGKEVQKYGICIKNTENEVVVETGDDGQLWLKNALKIETNGYAVSLGKLSNEQIINANNNFIVYNDGSVRANSGEFTGTINAREGAIGNLTLKDGNLISNKDQNFSIQITDSNNNTREALVISDNQMFIYGTINASEGGNIGGFKIENGKLVSENGGVELDGSGAGNIVANTIQLGTGANINNYIQLGNAKIQNPINPDNRTDNNRPFISAGNNKLEIYQDGNIKAGNITIDGSASKIYGTNFSITPEAAHFSNVNVSGAIETAVFKTNSVQAAGGAMIFRPSYKGSLKKEEDGTFVVYLENVYEGAIGNQVQVVSDGDNQGYFGEIEAVEQDRVSIKWSPTSKEFAEQDSIVLIDYGCNTYVKVAYNYPIENEKYYVFDGEKYSEINIEDNYSIFSKDAESDYLSSTDLSDDDNDGVLESKNELIIENGQLINSIRNLYTLQDDILIGINSGRSKVGAGGKILPRGLTLTSLEETMPKLYLGDLSQVGPNYSGYGLYADNVFLNGSLTTKSDTGSYAGVNTLSGVPGDTSVVGTDSNIIFWAGARDGSEEAIQDAPFQVTENGYVYLRNSLIAGGELRAAKIRGWNDGKESALSIYDTSSGISFKTDNDGEEQEIFAITSNGLRIEDNYFIKIDEGQAILKTRGATNYVALQEYNELPALFHHHSKDQWCGLFFDNNKTEFKFGVGENAVNSASFSNNEIVFSQKVIFDQGAKKLQYKSMNDGYDLYIV